MKGRPILLGSLAAGLLASACCMGPLILGAIGLGSVGVGVWLAPARPWFLGLTALLLAIAFYLAYRPVRETACAAGEPCETAQSRRPLRSMLWIVTVVAAALATYPSWGARPGGSQSLSGAPDSSAGWVTLDVSGMTCEACAYEIEEALREVPGVAKASVDYERSRAEVAVSRGFGDERSLIAAVEKAGYRAKTPASNPPGGSTDSTLGLAGHWVGRLTVNEKGDTSELIVDLDYLGGRWTGQFDLLGFGVEDYPVDVVVEGRTVTLHLSAAQTDFTGELDKAGEALAGTVPSDGHLDSLVLRRVGDARLSEEFVRLEVLSGDPTAIERLSANGAELRARFNEDRAYTRLVMLLSPT